MTVTSFRAHSRANGPVCHCATALMVIAREATRASAGSRRRSRSLGKAKVLTTIDPLLVVGSIAGSYKAVNRGDDVEREPGARHDDWTDAAPSIDRWIGVSSDFALSEFGHITAILD